MRNDQRRDAENEGERCHDDRTQSLLGRFQGGILRRHSRVTAFASRLHNQDCILGGQSDQHDESDLNEDVDIQVRDPESGNRAQQAHRNDQQDRHRHRPAFVLCGENQEDQDDRANKCVECRAPFQQLQVRQFRPFVCHRTGQLGIGGPLDRGNHVA